VCASAPAARRVCECPGDRGALPQSVLPASTHTTDSDGPPGVQVPRRPPAGCACAPAARRVCKCPGEREALPQGVLPTSTTDSDGPPGGTSTPTAARRLDPAACRVCECPDRRGALPQRRAANLVTSTDSDGPPGGTSTPTAARRVCKCPGRPPGVRVPRLTRGATPKRAANLDAYY